MRLGPKWGCFRCLICSISISFSNFLFFVFYFCFCRSVWRWFGIGSMKFMLYLYINKKIALHGWNYCCPRIEILSTPLCAKLQDPKIWMILYHVTKNCVIKHIMSLKNVSHDVKASRNDVLHDEPLRDEAFWCSNCFSVTKVQFITQCLEKMR